MVRAACTYRNVPSIKPLVLASLLMAFAHTPLAAEPEYVPDVGPGAVADPALSGDGRIMAWADRNGATPTLYLSNLETGTQTTLLLRTTTGDTDLDFPNAVGPSLNDDGTRIALVVDRPGRGRRPEALLVIDNSGAQLAKVTASLGSGEIADFQDRAFISGDGRYVTFSSEGRRFEATGISGNGLLTFGDDFTIKTLRLEVATGALTLAAFDATGALPNDDSSAQGISDDGQFVLFCSNATDLPAANGRPQAYRSDPDNGTVIQVSRDNLGASVSGIYCGDDLFEDEYLGISDNGQRVVYTENRGTAADGEDHTFVWTEGAGSREITGLQKYASVPISGDGLWLAPEDEPFSRLDIDTGATDAVPFRIRSPRISDNGGTLLFFNDMLPRPAGQTGDWWVLRYATAPPTPDPPPLLLHLEERITIGDGTRTLPGVRLAVNETVSVGHAISPLTPPPSVNGIELVINPPLLPGDVFTASATGFKPFSLVRAWLQSTPVLVGEEEADEFGRVSFVITVPENFPPGPHTLVLLGVAPDGSERRLEAPITVSARGAGVEGSVVAIPAGQPWSLLLLVFGLLGIARMHLRQLSARKG
jgi:hypothetical protein